MANTRRGIEMVFAENTDLDMTWFLAVVPAILDVTGARWLAIDPFGGSPAGDRILAETDLPGRAGKSGVVMLDPRDSRDVAAFAKYAKFSANAEIGVTGPSDLVFEAVDAEWTGLSLTAPELDALDLALDPDVWTRHFSGQRHDPHA
jgi:hypothetical protein